MRHEARGASAPYIGRSTSRISGCSPYARERDELRESGDEVSSIPQAGVLLEVGIEGGVVENLAPGRSQVTFGEDKGARAMY